MSDRDTAEAPSASLLERSARLAERILPFALGLFIFTTPFSKVIASITHSVVLILFLLYRFYRRQPWVAAARPLYWLIIIYSLAVTLGITYSDDPANGVHEAWRQVTRLATMVVLIEMVSTGERARRYLHAFSAGGVVLALIGIYEAVFMHIERPPSMWHPVHGANILLFTCIASVVLFADRPRDRIYALGAAVVMLFAIYLTQTRGVWVAAASVLLTLPFLFSGISRRKKLFLILASLAVLFLVSQAPIVQERSRQALHEVRQYTKVGDSHPPAPLTERFDMWKASWLMFKKHPVLGVGTGGWGSAVKELVLGNQVPATLIAWGNPHNIYFEALSTRGLPGVVLLLGLLLYPAWFAWKKRHHGPGEMYVLLLLSASIGFSISGLTDTLIIIRGVFTSYLIVTGLALAMLFRQHGSARDTI